MKCIYCGNEESKVIDSRISNEGLSIRRRRECLECGRRWTTFETVENENLVVVKKDQSRQAFSDKKLQGSITKACEKRPISTTKIEEICADIKRELQNNGLKEIPAKDIGNLVLEKLKTLDVVAYIRYASVFKGFNNIADFARELKQFIK